VQSRPYVAEDEIDLRGLALALWRRRWVILGVTAVAAALAAGVSLYVLPPVYESRTYIQLSEHSAQAYATPAAAARALTSLSFLRPVAARHGIADGRRLERMVRAEPVRDTRMVYLRIRDNDPERLRRFTTEVVNEFMRSASAKAIQRRRLAEKRYQVLAEQIRMLGPLVERVASDLTRAEGRGTSRDPSAAWLRQAYAELLKAQEQAAEELAKIEPPSLVQQPYIPAQPVSPKPALNAAVAGTLGFLVAVFGVLLREAWAGSPQAEGQLGTISAG
jgi:uncharacterized protein involved in exopolysaccharide biosynthesis